MVPRSQLTASGTPGLATALFFELSPWACRWTASCLVQPAQRGGSSLLLSGSLVPSWRWNRTDLPFPIKCPPWGGGSGIPELASSSGSSLGTHLNNGLFSVVTGHIIPQGASAVPSCQLALGRQQQFLLLGCIN